MSASTQHPVERHYGRAGLAERILDALRAAGKDPEALQPEDLTPVEEFHIRGRQATEELAALAKVGAGMQVLDVGCGVGGPARFLARVHGCHVIGVDLTAEFVRTAQMLTERVGLGERVTFHQADALDMPFEDAAFDLAWTQHAAMNISDRPRLYAEIARVLAPGGRLAVYDIVARSGEPLEFPVPWAGRPELSHLVTADDMRALLEDVGFAVEAWRDVTSAGTAWAQDRIARINEEPGPLSPELNMGPDWRDKVTNLVRNLEAGRIALIQAVLVRAE